MRQCTYEVHPHSQEAKRRPSRLFHIAMSTQSGRRGPENSVQNQLMESWKLPWLSVVAEPEASITEPLNEPTT